MKSGDKYELTRLVRQLLQNAGFSHFGISHSEPLNEDTERLDEWLANGYHAGMKWMENHREMRNDPGNLVKGAKSVISVLYNYYPSKTFPANQYYAISKYAYGDDYHFVIRRKLTGVIKEIESRVGPINARAFTDSAPVFDRAWAERAGLGWIGKNTCLINPKIGSFFFIGEIICDLELEYDQSKVKDMCGGCSKCIDACPTGAILSGKKIDANRCVSYFTIEHRDKLPAELKDKFDNMVFGCDICQDVCPWNRIARPHKEEAFRPSDELVSMNKEKWEALDEVTFKKLFRKSPLKRTGFDGLKRNIHFVKPEKSK